jgi:hypothetical protein
MTLRTLFTIPVAMILLVVLSLAGMLVAEGLTTLNQGDVAVAAVNRMRELVLLQSDLWSERVVSNAAMSQDLPLSADTTHGLAAERAKVDARLDTLTFSRAARRTGKPEPYLTDLRTRVTAVRAEVDRLLTRPRATRTFEEESGVMPMMLAASRVMEEPLAHAAMDVIAADRGLSGLMTAARLSALLKDRYSALAGVLVPRFTVGQALTPDDVEAAHVLWAQIVQLTGLLDDTIDFASPPPSVRAALAVPRRAADPSTRERLERLLSAGQAADAGLAEVSLAQAFILPWSRGANRLRIAIVDAALSQVQEAQRERRYAMTLVSAATGAVVVGLIASLALLRLRVVRPLASLGLAITRIAAGDRRDPVSLPAQAREIAAIVEALETLRQAALIADATAMAQREAEEQRLRLLREALAAVQTVREPAQALEDGIAGLCRGIDDAISLIAPPDGPARRTLTEAANAVRLALAEVRGASADLDSMITTARKTPADAWPEADIVAHVLAVRAHVERRDAAVRALIPPSLAALRDTVAPAIAGSGRDDLVTEQFERIETAVAMVASMHAAVTRAGNILRELPLETPALAA